MTQSLRSHADRQPILGASHRDVEQPPLLLDTQRLAAVDRVARRQQPLLAADDEHNARLGALCGVDRADRQPRVSCSALNASAGSTTRLLENPTSDPSSTRLAW